MRFASLGGSNAGKYAAAGKAASNTFSKVLAAQLKSRPDHAGLNIVAMNTAANERIAGMKAKGELTNVAQKVYADQKRVDIDIDLFNKKSDINAGLRKAGGIAAIGKMVGAGYLASRDNTKGRDRPKTDYSSVYKGYKNKRDALLSAYEDSLTKITDTDTSTTKKVDGGTTESTTKPLGSSLTGNQKTVADAIAKYESGDLGYEAFNQGGANGGTKVLGKSGSYKQTYGSSLTDMTLGQIYHKQNTKDRGLSMQEHLDSGGLHAVGRYQFIGPTLQDEARRMGLSDDTKFTPEVQDNIFLSHIKRVGNISPWVGPSNNYSAGQKQEFNSMIAGF